MLPPTRPNIAVDEVNTKPSENQFDITSHNLRNDNNSMRSYVPGLGCDWAMANLSLKGGVVLRHSLILFELAFRSTCFAVTSLRRKPPKKEFLDSC